MTFHGIIHGLPRKPDAFEMAPSLFHRIAWNLVTFNLAKAEFQGIPWNVLWNLWHLKWCHPNSIEFHETLLIIDIELHGTSVNLIWRRQIPWYSMEYSMEFHGTLVSFEMVSSKFHGIPLNFPTFDLAAAQFHGIPWNIPWNSTEPCCHLKWRPPSSMELHGTWWHCIWRRLSSMKFHGIFRGSPG